MRNLIVFLLLCGLSPAQGMFDLPGGTWQGKTVQGQRLLLHTNTAPDHGFRLEYGEAVVITGQYRVTATKGKPHVSFTPKSITLSQQKLPEFFVEGWPMKADKDSRAILEFQDQDVSIDTFDPEIQFLWRLKLTRQPE